MSFSQMMELLQIKEKGRIVICNAGDFYVAIGKDAILLNKILGLKVTCFKTEVCKVGFPIQSLEKYTELLIKSRYNCKRSTKRRIETSNLILYNWTRV